MILIVDNRLIVDFVDLHPSLHFEIRRNWIDHLCNLLEDVEEVDENAERQFRSLHHYHAPRQNRWSPNYPKYLAFRWG